MLRGALGFSLLETIVTLVLLALMIALLPGVLDLGRQALKAERAVDQEDQFGSTDAVLRRLIRTIRPARRTDGDGRVLVKFNGESAAMTFVAEAPDSLQSAGLVTYRLGLAPALSGRPGLSDLVLILGQSSASDDAPLNDARRAVLLEDVTALNFAYFGPSPDERGARWHQLWTDRDQVPQAIEITITRNDRERRIVQSIARSVLR